MVASAGELRETSLLDRGKNLASSAIVDESVRFGGFGRLPGPRTGRKFDPIHARRGALAIRDSQGRAYGRQNDFEYAERLEKLVNGTRKRVLIRGTEKAITQRKPAAGGLGQEKGPWFSEALTTWRSRWDSNPRYGITVHRISSPAHSTTLPPLLIRFAWCEARDSNRSSGQPLHPAHVAGAGLPAPSRSHPRSGSSPAQPPACGPRPGPSR